MIFSDKLIGLRKKSGMSQEELAEKMNVSRQSVSKWEGAQSVPDLEKILQLGDLFGVTTDYLLKDEIENEEFSKESSSEAVRKISLEQANEFLALNKKAAPRMALATFLCIISVIPLIVLGGMTELTPNPISENFAGGLGMIILIVLVAIAVGIFIYTDFQLAPYKFLDTEQFETEYGVVGMAREQQKAYRDTYMKSNIAGTCLCILSVISLFAGVFSENEFLLVILLGVMIFIIGIGVCFFVNAGVRRESIQKLLKEGDFTEEKKNRSRTNRIIAVIYWSVVVAIYLAWLFIDDASAHYNSHSWVVFPVAAMLFVALKGIIRLINKNKS